MAKTILKLKNPYTDNVKTVPLGFSWTVLLFGFLVPLYRKDWEMTIVMFLLYILTLGFISIIFAFTYNTIYARSLFKRGYILLYFWGPLTNKKLYSLTFTSLND